MARQVTRTGRKRTVVLLPPVRQLFNIGPRQILIGVHPDIGIVRVIRWTCLE